MFAQTIELNLTLTMKQIFPMFALLLCGIFPATGCSAAPEGGRPGDYIYTLDDAHVIIETPDEDWTFGAGEKISFSLSVTKTFLEKLDIEAVCVVKSDTREPIETLRYPVECEPFVKFSVPVEFTPPAPGFYRFETYITDGVRSSPVRYFNMGSDPENIPSPPDETEGFDQFWAATRAELDLVEPRYSLTPMPELSTGVKNVYKVEMYSWGEVLIGGFYSVPKTEGPHPGVMHFLGYGTGLLYPDTNSMPGYCELQLSVRGQGIMKANNPYGEWITYGLGGRDSYYYRGAYIDLVRGVDFLCSRPEVDSCNIFAGGGSQGGAFVVACCALDDRIKAAAAYVPFLSDFRDYFAITGWPRSLVENYLAANPSADWEEVYGVLKWFDVRNLAPRISCPFIMGVGLQDETCPPHINFAAYNKISFKLYGCRSTVMTFARQWR